MTERGDKGLLITTGTFTAEAIREASRDGAPPIDLVDGEALCELLKQYELGVETKQVEDVLVKPELCRYHQLPVLHPHKTLRARILPPLWLPLDLGEETPA